MAVRLRCSRGHVWEFLENNGSTLPLAAGHCPVCSQPSEEISLVGDTTLQAESHTTPYTESDSVSRPSAPTVAGYEILAELGRGGMGVVYRARQRSLNRIVALKMPHDRLTSSPAQLDRFRREAESVASLRHPNIVQVHDYGVLGERPYFSMEFLDGGSLANRITNTHVPARPAAHLVATLARAIHAAHQSGVVHRDLKPANILVTTDGIPKVSDFGLALSFVADDRRDADALEGTPSYMAPEQASGQVGKIGPATDVYGLGAILYRMLTGRSPFDGRTAEETLNQVRTSQPVPPRKLQSAVPRDLEAICLKCLDKEPANRYATAESLAADLDHFLAGDAVSARATTLPEKSVRFARRRPMWIAGMVMLIGSAAAALLYWNAYHRMTIEHFADQITRWGAPVGVRRLSAEEVRHRDASLRFHSRAGRVIAIDVIDAKGELTTRHRFGGNIATAEEWLVPNRPECRFLYTYDRDGRIATETATDALGDVVWSFIFTTPTTGHYIDRRGFIAPQSPSGAAYIEFTFTDDGRPATEHFLDANRNIKPDGLGSCGARRDFDDEGRIIRTVYLGSDDCAHQTLSGFAGITYEYDDDGNLSRAELLDEGGNRGVAKPGISLMRFSWDRWGNLNRYSYFDKDDKRCYWNGQYHAFDIVRDDSGRTTWVRLFNIEDRPMVCEQGFAAVGLEFEFGNLPLRQTHYNEKGDPCNTTAGYGRIDRTYDTRGDILTEAIFDRGGLPVAGQNGIHQNIWKYARGDKIELWMKGVDGKPAADKSGIAHLRYKYDDRHQNIKVENLGDDDQAIVNAAGVATWKMRYDDKGNEIERRFLGIDGNLCRNIYGTAIERSKYDPDGKRIAIAFFDEFDHELEVRVVIVQIDPDGAAGAVGLKVGDILERYAGLAISESEDVVKARKIRSGDSAFHEVVVRRDGKTVVVQIPHGPSGFSFQKRFVPK